MNNLDENISQTRLIDNIKITRKRREAFAVIKFINAADAKEVILEDAKEKYQFGENELIVKYWDKKNSSLTKVFVGNLPLDVSTKAIEKLFNGITEKNTENGKLKNEYSSLSSKATTHDAWYTQGTKQPSADRTRGCCC